MRRRLGLGATRATTGHDVTLDDNGRRRDCALLVIFILASALYVWTIASSGTRIQFQGDPVNYYGELTSGFLHGELSIPELPAKALLATPDPYLQAYNHPWRPQIEDLSLYHGHFYLDWGPTPVITLYLPWRLVGLGTMAEDLVLGIYSIVGLFFLLLLLRVLVRLYAPRASTFRVALAGIVVATGSVVPFIDRTPDIYEEAIACGYCFLAIGLYLLASGGLGGRRVVWRLSLGSFSLGLAAGGRWDLLLAGALLPALLLWIVRRDKLSWSLRSLRIAGALVGPFALCVVLLLAYNYARFGSPFQVGTSYQLAGYDPRTTHFYQLAYLWPDLYYFFVAPVRWSLGFPYFALPPPPLAPTSVPATFFPELTGGILTTTPVLVFLLAVPFMGRRRVDMEWRIVAAVLACLGIVIAAFLSWGIPGATMRYEVDFATLLIIPAITGWLILQPRRQVGRLCVSGAGGLIAIYGVIVALAISLTGYRSQIFTTSSGQVTALENLTQPFATWVTGRLGHPVLTSIQGDDVIFAPSYGSLGVGHVVYSVFGAKPLVLEAQSPNRATWTLSVGLGINSALPSKASVTVAVRDRSGVHRYHWNGVLGAVDYPVHLWRGRNVITLSASVTGDPALRGARDLVAASLISLGGPEINP